MSKIVTIPTDGGNPFVIIHNGIEYIYPPGETVTVSDGVALEIEEWKRWREKYRNDDDDLLGDVVKSVNGVKPDKNGNVNLDDLIKGADGYSPTVIVTKVGKATAIAITDKNGTKVAAIYDGEDGKSAYQYAKEGGFTGTEAEFSTKLAELLNAYNNGGGSFNITDDGNGNVTITTSGGASITDDGNGNVVIIKENYNGK